MGDTYVISRAHLGREGIHCLLCDAISYSTRDVTERYCGACHLFHEDVAVQRRLAVVGIVHHCSGWRTARGLCAVCGNEA